MTDRQRVEEIRQIGREFRGDTSGIAWHIFDELMSLTTAVERERDQAQDDYDAASHLANSTSKAWKQAQADLAAVMAMLKEWRDRFGGMDYHVGIDEFCFDLDKFLKQPRPGTALLQERDRLQARAAELEELLWQLYEGIYGHRNADHIDPFKTAVGGALHLNKAWYERDTKTGTDHLRALLILACDRIYCAAFLDENARQFLRSIADAVSPTGQVTEADVRWAREQLSKQ